MSQQSPAKKAKGCKKLRRCSKPRYKQGYALGFSHTERNKKRNLRRQIRNNPADKQSIQRYEQTYGVGTTLGLTARGERLLARMLAAI
jgi:hypothetical protein